MSWYLAAGANEPAALTKCRDAFSATVVLGRHAIPEVLTLRRSGCWVQTTMPMQQPTSMADTGDERAPDLSPRKRARRRRAGPNDGHRSVAGGVGIEHADNGTWLLDDVSALLSGRAD
jgi:hypothetical protein